MQPGPPDRADVAYRAVVIRGAVLAGLCRLVPVPFLDDYLVERSRRHMIESLFAAHGRPGDAPLAAPLYSDPASCLGAIVAVVTFPLVLVVKLLKKVFKTLFLVLALRDAALQVGRTLLLGYTAHRRLAAGGFSGARPIAEAVAEARATREAFDAAFGGSDTRFLRHLVGGLIQGVGGAFARLKGLVGAVYTGVVSALGRTQDAGGTTRVVDDLSRRVEEVLATEEVVGFVGEFDRRFDAEFAARVSPPASA